MLKIHLNIPRFAGNNNNKTNMPQQLSCAEHAFSFLKFGMGLSLRVLWMHLL